LRLAHIAAGLHLAQRHVEADLLKAVDSSLFRVIGIFLVHFVRFFGSKW
jgi:hypothetical protein